MAEDPPGPFACACGVVFKTHVGYRRHAASYCMKGYISQHDAGQPDLEAQQAAAVTEEAAATSHEDGYARSLFRAVFKGLTSLRLKFNASNAMIQRVKDMVQDVRKEEQVTRFQPKPPAFLAVAVSPRQLDCAAH